MTKRLLIFGLGMAALMACVLAAWLSPVVLNVLAIMLFAIAAGAIPVVFLMGAIYLFERRRFQDVEEALPTEQPAPPANRAPIEEEEVDDWLQPAQYPASALVSAPAYYPSRWEMLEL